jgi:predicted PurR-regulated permease PerM
MLAVGIGRQVTFWISALLGLFLVFWLLRGILLPFVAGAALAYAFNPLAVCLERLGASRLIASLLIIVAFVLAFIVLILLIAPVLFSQLSSFIDNIPGYFRRVQGILADPSRPWLRRMLGSDLAGADASVSDLITQGTGWLTTFLRSLWSGGQALLSVFSLLVVTPVVAFYLLYDWDRMLATIDRWVPRPQRDTVRHLAHEIDRAIAGFVRGQTTVCLALGTFYALGLTLTGLNYGVLIGLAAGLISFIPYVGSMTGLTLAAGVALAQFWPDWTSILMVVGVFFMGQFLEGYILSPKLVGERIGLHPVWLIFALFAFGYLFGFVGMLLAVPLAAAVGVVSRFALRRYLESSFYTGQPTVMLDNMSVRRDHALPSPRTD